MNWKPPLQTVVLAAVLTLAVWIFFYIETPEAPLDLKGTTLVAAVCLLIAVPIRSVWAIIWKK